MENEHNHGAFKGAVVTILLLLLVCAGICTYKYVKGEIPNVTQTDIESEVETVPTVEEAMQEWNASKEISRCYEIYNSFPPEIMQALFEKLGTQEPIRSYVYEYEKNREYYISLQIARQLEKAGLENAGIDGKRIQKVKVDTELKPEEPKQKIEIPAVPITKDTTKLSIIERNKLEPSHYYWDMEEQYYYTESRL